MGRLTVRRRSHSPGARTILGAAVTAILLAGLMSGCGSPAEPVAAPTPTTYPAVLRGTPVTTADCTSTTSPPTGETTTVARTERLLICTRELDGSVRETSIDSSDPRFTILTNVLASPDQEAPAGIACQQLAVNPRYDQVYANTADAAYRVALPKAFCGGVQPAVTAALDGVTGPSPTP